MNSHELTDEQVLSAFPGVLIDRDNIVHYRGLLDNRLLVNQCQDCHFWIYPHRPLCPRCLSSRVNATEVSGIGAVFMFTRVHQERDPQQRLREPIIAAAIELVEQKGLRYLAPLANCGSLPPALDMPVQLIWLDRATPAFEPLITEW